MFSGGELDIKGCWEKNSEFFHDIIMIFGSKSEKIRENFGFFFECAEISAPRGQKTTFVEKIFKNYFAKVVGGYSLKVSNFSPSYKKSYLNVNNRG